MTHNYWLVGVSNLENLLQEVVSFLSDQPFEGKDGKQKA